MSAACEGRARYSRRWRFFLLNREATLLELDLDKRKVEIVGVDDVVVHA